MNRYAQYARWNAVRKATGYRSGFEAEVGAALDPHGALSEPVRIQYDLHLTGVYKPDWLLPAQCIVLEAKGRFPKEDRDKLLLIKQQYPHLDIRLIFQSLTARTSPKIGQTYAQWASAHGFPCCKGPAVPEDWLSHKPSARSRKAFEAIHAPRR